MKRLLAVLVMVCLACAGYVYASGAGTVGGEILKFGSGARSAGMGEAFTAIGNDPHAVYWNPAGLVQLNSKELQLMYLQHVADTGIGDIAYAQKLSPKTGIGVELIQLYVKEAQRDDNGNYVGDFTDYNGSLSVGLGVAVDESLSVGLSVKGLYYRYMDQVYTGQGMDAGAMYKLSIAGKESAVGVVLKDLGPDLQTRVVAGLSSVVMSNLLVSADVTSDAGQTTMNMGMEYQIGSRFVMRTGYMGVGGWEGLEGVYGITAGAGLKFKGYDLDYAFIPYGDLGIAHRVSFLMKF